MRITWDVPSERRYKVGTDRGVFYLRTNGEYPMGVVWNGLTGVEESLGGREVTSLYTGDIRVDLTKTRPERSGTINCITYPDEMDACIGCEEAFPGVDVYDQNEESFGFTYRKLIGTSDEGTSHGYEIHVIYNSTITGFNESASTINSQMDVDPMGFQFTSLPEEMDGYDPVTHLVFNSLRFGKSRMAAIEDVLYGTRDTNPRLPLPNELISLLQSEAFLNSVDAVSTYTPEYGVYTSSTSGESADITSVTAESRYDLTGLTYVSTAEAGSDGPSAESDAVSSSDPLVGLSFTNTVTVG